MMMYVLIQMLLIPPALGLGIYLARGLQRQGLNRAARQRALIGYTAGFLAWLPFSLFCLPSPFNWVFLATAMAAYLPCLCVLCVEPKSGH